MIFTDNKKNMYVFVYLFQGKDRPLLKERAWATKSCWRLLLKMRPGPSSNRDLNLRTQPKTKGKT